MYGGCEWRVGDVFVVKGDINCVEPRGGRKVGHCLG